jgi:hypothetical protein
MQESTLSYDEKKSYALIIHVKAQTIKGRLQSENEVHDFLRKATHCPLLSITIQVDKPVDHAPATPAKKLWTEGEKLEMICKEHPEFAHLVTKWQMKID